MGRPVKSKSLTPQAVIMTAIDCLDREGEAALGVNRVAKALGIKPPAIYKHLDGNTGLRRAVALQIWRDYLRDCQQQLASVTAPRELLLASARAIRNFAKLYPARYAVMMQYQLRPNDSEEVVIIQTSLQMFRQALQLYELSAETLIDVMRMIDAAIYGFIIREQSDLMTLDRSADDSYQVMLEGLIVAIEHIQAKN
jgi:AcrR family transcriptional regulator